MSELESISESESEAPAPIMHKPIFPKIEKDMAKIKRDRERAEGKDDIPDSVSTDEGGTPDSEVDENGCLKKNKC